MHRPSYPAAHKLHCREYSYATSLLGLLQVCNKINSRKTCRTASLRVSGALIAFLLTSCDHAKEHGAVNIRACLIEDLICLLL